MNLNDSAIDPAGGLDRRDHRAPGRRTSDRHHVMAVRLREIAATVRGAGVEDDLTLDAHHLDLIAADLDRGTS